MKVAGVFEIPDGSSFDKAELSFSVDGKKAQIIKASKLSELPKKREYESSNDNYSIGYNHCLSDIDYEYDDGSDMYYAFDSRDCEMYF